MLAGYFTDQLDKQQLVILLLISTYHTNPAITYLVLHGFTVAIVFVLDQLVRIGEELPHFVHFRVVAGHFLVHLVDFCLQMDNLLILKSPKMNKITTKFNNTDTLSHLFVQLFGCFPLHFVYFLLLAGHLLVDLFDHPLVHRQLVGHFVLYGCGQLQL